jgi:hypothetical protein
MKMIRTVKIFLRSSMDLKIVFATTDKVVRKLTERKERNDLTTLTATTKARLLPKAGTTACVIMRKMMIKSRMFQPT